MEVRMSSTYECRLYIGSQRGYGGRSFSQKILIEAIQDFQDNLGQEMCPVRVSSCDFICGKGYQEKGWEIAAIVYPNTEKTEMEIANFMISLAPFLLNKFEQNRITVVQNDSRCNTIMYRAENAQIADRHT